MFILTYFTVFLAISAPVLAAPKKHKGNGHRHHHSQGGGNSLPDTTSTTMTSTEPEDPTNTSSQPQQPTATGGTGSACSGSCYKQSGNWVGSSWLDSGDWDFYDRSDPTHGRVDYVGRDRAMQKNLTYATGDAFIMRADSTTTLDSGGAGRESIRIVTKKEYTTFASVVDIRKMPLGPGVWPAFWMTGKDWPNSGELDIVEGVDGDTSNLISLHTSQGCTQPKAGRKMTGDVGYDDCDAHGAKGNQGCGVRSTDNKSFGTGFNENGGGWFATERTDKYIKVWFWPRDASDVPADVRDNTGSVGPESWGKPTALFVSDSCDLAAKFGGNWFVWNLTLCGDWAGSKFDGGKAKCEEYVNKHPEAYKDALWNVARMTVYEQ